MRYRVLYRLQVPTVPATRIRTDEPFKEYRNFEIDVRMIRAVAVDIGSARKVIPETAKTFSFVGDGTAVEVMYCTTDRLPFSPLLLT